MRFPFISKAVLVLWTCEFAFHALGFQSTSTLDLSIGHMPSAPESSSGSRPSAIFNLPIAGRNPTTGEYDILAGQFISPTDGRLNPTFKQGSGIHTAARDATTELVIPNPAPEPLSTLKEEQIDELERQIERRAGTGEATVESKTTRKQAKAATVGLATSSTGEAQAELLCSADCEICRSSGLGRQKESRPKLLTRHSGTGDTNSTVKRDWELVGAPKIVEISRDADGESTSEMARLEDSILTMGQLGLYGCSSVVVVSRYAVYMSHLYEVPSFAAFKNGRDARDGLRFVESEFKKRVSDFLSKGELKKPEFIGSKKFPKPSTQAIIITPRGSRDAKFKYAKLVNRISEELTKAMKLSKKPVVQSYSVDGATLEKENGSGDSPPDGKLVLEYVPNGGMPIKDCKANATVALFLGDPEHGKEYPVIFTSHWVRDVHGGKCPEATTTAGKETTETVAVAAKVEAVVTKELGPKPTGFDCKGSPVCGGVPIFPKDKDLWWEDCNAAVAELNDEEYYGTVDGNNDTGGCAPRVVFYQMPACGVFVEGDNCQVKGKYFKGLLDMIKESPENPESCNYCGSAHLENGCKLKVDHIVNCIQQGVDPFILPGP